WSGRASTSSPQRRTPSPGTAISPTRSALSRSPSWPSVSGCPTMSPASRTGRSGRRMTSS
ncbi:Core-binding (CB) domain-containing protein, partial [Dysosmobacter welbionis]